MRDRGGRSRRYLKHAPLPEARPLPARDLIPPRHIAYLTGWPKGTRRWPSPSSRRAVGQLNIAEGCGRTARADNAKHYTIARVRPWSLLRTATSCEWRVERRRTLHARVRGDRTH